MMQTHCSMCQNNTFDLCTENECFTQTLKYEKEVTISCRKCKHCVTIKIDTEDL